MKKFKILILLLFCLLGFVNFSNAGVVNCPGTIDGSCIPNGGTASTMYGFSGFNIHFHTDYDISNVRVSLRCKNTHLTFITGDFDYTIPDCAQISLRQFDASDPFSITLSPGNSSCPECEECETCPEINTGDILSGSCDTNFCVENDLCPVPSNFSQLFINDLEFPGKPLINVNIPDYIQWDYSSNDTGFDLFVGSGYDQDYIDSVLKINSYRPDSSDFTNIFVSGLTLLFPYLIFALFILFMRKLIKRIFKH